MFHCGKPETWQLVLYYLCLGAFLLWRFCVRELRKKRTARAAALGEEEEEEEEKRPEPNLRKRRILSAAGLLLLILLLSVRFSRGFQFTMLDVGQGDDCFCALRRVRRFWWTEEAPACQRQGLTGFCRS